MTQTHSTEGSAVGQSGADSGSASSSISSSYHSGADSPLSYGVSMPSSGEPLAKRPRRDQGESSSAKTKLRCFKPSSLIKHKEGTFQAPAAMKRYLNKYSRRCLLKEEREALFKEYPKPNVEACTPPKIDKFISDFLGKRLPKERDAELSKIQTAILACIRPLTSAWQQLVEAKMESDPQMTVPASEVLTLIQQTVCLVGNASELTSQIRRAQILGAIDSSWSKFSSESFESASDTLFGEEFQESLTKKVEKETALSKAVSITKRNKREGAPSRMPTSSFSRKDRQKPDQFFRRGPPAKYGGRQGGPSYPYRPYHQKQPDPRRGRPPFNLQRQTQQPLFHEPSLPPQKAQQKKSWTS